VVVGVAILGLVAGGGAWLLRDFGRNLLTRDVTTVAGALRSGQDADVERARTELGALSADYKTGLDEVRARRAELDALLAQAREAVARDADARRLAEEEQRRVETERGALRVSAPAAVGGAGNAAGPASDREAEALTELYRRLARLEASLSALTNPVLLPGEPFAVPDEFLPEALRWENWKEVGEAAFNLGDYANGARILLESRTAEAVGGCITTVRAALTRSVYPNLGHAPSKDQLATLRRGLGELAKAIPDLRRTLEGRYRAVADGGPSNREGGD